MNVSRYFRSSYSIGTGGYKWDNELDKVIPTGTENYLEEIDRRWIQHTDDCDTRNKYYRDANHGEYAINVGSYDIAEALGRPYFMEDGNESLLTMGMQKNYGDTNIIEGTTLVTYQTEASTFTTNLPRENEKLKEMMAKHQDTISQERI